MWVGRDVDDCGGNSSFGNKNCWSHTPLRYLGFLSSFLSAFSFPLRWRPLLLFRETRYDVSRSYSISSSSCRPGRLLVKWLVPLPRKSNGPLPIFSLGVPQFSPLHRLFFFSSFFYVTSYFSRDRSRPTLTLTPVPSLPVWAVVRRSVGTPLVSGGRSPTLVFPGVESLELPERYVTSVRFTDTKDLFFNLM